MRSSRRTVGPPRRRVAQRHAPVDPDPSLGRLVVRERPERATEAFHFLDIEVPRGVVVPRVWMFIVCSRAMSAADTWSGGSAALTIR
jgi:hypothetical protein